MGKRPIVIDLFCGAGGESSGITQVLNDHGIEPEMYAVNHWDLALETHGMNHPTAAHYCEDVFKGTAKKHIGNRRVSLLWASPECTFHSNARGGGVCNPQSRAGANSVLEWCRDLTIDRVICENVKEWFNWGPLGPDGKPDKRYRTYYFRQWRARLMEMGYDVESRVLCAADYAAPTSRERLFVQAVRRDSKKKISFPAPWLTRDQWVPASAVIDWTDLGTPLHLRETPLVERTLARIEKGIIKYWGEWAEPYLVILRGQSSTRPVSEPLPTVTCGQHFGLVCPIDNGSDPGGCRSTDEPLSTIVVKQRHSLAVPLIMGKHSDSPCQDATVAPVPTLTTKQGPQMITPLIMGKFRTSVCKPVDSSPIPTLSTASAPTVISPLIMGQHSGSQCKAATGSPVPTVTTIPRVQLITPLIASYYGTGVATPVDRPIPTVTTKQRFGLVTPYELGIGYRMLQARELSMGTGFHADYKFAGNKTQVVKQIGNAVPPPLAYAQVLPYIEEFKQECL